MLCQSRLFVGEKQRLVKRTTEKIASRLVPPLPPLPPLSPPSPLEPSPSPLVLLLGRSHGPLCCLHTLQLLG